MNKKKTIAVFLWMVFQAAAVSCVFAQENPSTDAGETSSYEDNLKRWQNMSEEQREAIRQKVQAMEPRQKEALLENAREYKQLSGEERNRIRGNFQEFMKLSLDQRDEVKTRYRRFQQMPTEKRQELRQQVRRKKTGAEGPINPDRISAAGNKEARRSNGGVLGKNNVGNRPGPRGSLGADSGKRPSIGQSSGTGRGPARQQVSGIRTGSGTRPGPGGVGKDGQRGVREGPRISRSAGGGFGGGKGGRARKK